MELPKYLIDALYQFSQDVLDEQVEFDRLHEEELASVEASKIKQSWIEHLFRPSK